MEISNFREKGWEKGVALAIRVVHLAEIYEKVHGLLSSYLQAFGRKSSKTGRRCLSPEKLEIWTPFHVFWVFFGNAWRYVEESHGQSGSSRRDIQESPRAYYPYLQPFPRKSSKTGRQWLSPEKHGF